MTGPEPRPSPVRALGLLVVAGTAGVLLWSLPIDDAPLADPAAIPAWWETTGTPAATAALVRLVGLCLAAALVVLGVAATAVATARVAWLTALWVAWAPARVRYGLAGVVLSASMASAAPVGAADPGPVPVVVDLGPVAADTPPRVPATDVVLRDLGPAEPTPGGLEHRVATGSPVEPDRKTPSAPAEVAPDDIWVVAAGDHLWSVAEETLRDRGLSPTTGEIASYWQRLIEANRAVVGDDPDLIHPGQALRLPGS